MKRLTIKGEKLGFCDSSKLPSYTGVYDRIAQIEDILGDTYDIDRLKEAIKLIDKAGDK